jgi:hypothetical protein
MHLKYILVVYLFDVTDVDIFSVNLVKLKQFDLAKLIDLTFGERGKYCTVSLWPFQLLVMLPTSSLKYLISGDANNVQIGSGTNIQDNSVVHVAKSNLSGKVFPTIIGNNVTVGKYKYTLF